MSTEILLQQWLKCIARKHFKPIKHFRICSLHFREEDFVSNSVDQHSKSKRKRETLKSVKRRLKEDACPIIFEDLPSYYSYKNTPACSGLAGSSTRPENAVARLEEQNDRFLIADKSANFNGFLTKICKEVEH